MENGISRRQFIKTVGVSFTGFGVAHISFICKETRWAGGRCCRHCGAIITGVHPFYDCRHSGAYCPNCGIDLHQGAWHLDADLPGQTIRGNGKPTWQYTQVPFPNPRLVEKTIKPTVFFKDIVL